jgi:hypothetical protein
VGVAPYRWPSARPGRPSGDADPVWRATVQSVPQLFQAGMHGGPDEGTCRADDTGSQQPVRALVRVGGTVPGPFRHQRIVTVLVRAVVPSRARSPRTLSRALSAVPCASPNTARVIDGLLRRSRRAQDAGRRLASHVLGDGLNDDLAVGQDAQISGERQPGRAWSRSASPNLPHRRPRSRDAATRSRSAVASSDVDSATVSSRPCRAATSAVPEPMSPGGDVGRNGPFHAEPK